LPQVALNYEDGNPVEAKGIGRKILDKVQQTYALELAGKDFAYDGEKSLFTIGTLPHNKLVFTVVLEDPSSSSRCSTRFLFAFYNKRFWFFKNQFYVSTKLLLYVYRSTTRGGSLERSPGEADKKRSKRQPRSKPYKVVIKYSFYCFI